MGMLAWGLQSGGLFVNLLGSLFLAIAYQAVPGGTQGTLGPSGVEPFVVGKYLGLWRWGLRLLVAGFAVQLVGLAVGLCA